MSKTLVSMILSIFLISTSILTLSFLPEDHSRFLISSLTLLRAFLFSSTCLLISLRWSLNSIALAKFSFNSEFNSSRILRCSLASLLKTSLSSATWAISSSLSSFWALTPSMVSANSKSGSGRVFFFLDFLGLASSAASSVASASSSASSSAASSSASSASSSAASSSTTSSSASSAPTTSSTSSVCFQQLHQ